MRVSGVSDTSTWILTKIVVKIEFGINVKALSDYVIFPKIRRVVQVFVNLSFCSYGPDPKGPYFFFPGNTC